jgi:hypothetical protein
VQWQENGDSSKLTCDSSQRHVFRVVCAWCLSDHCDAPQFLGLEPFSFFSFFFFFGQGHIFWIGSCYVGQDGLELTFLLI